MKFDCEICLKLGRQFCEYPNRNPVTLHPMAPDQRNSPNPISLFTHQVEINKDDENPKEFISSTLTSATITKSVPSSTINYQENYSGHRYYYPLYPVYYVAYELRQKNEI